VRSRSTRLQIEKFANLTPSDRTGKHEKRFTRPTNLRSPPEEEKKDTTKQTKRITPKESTKKISKEGILNSGEFRHESTSP